MLKKMYLQHVLILLVLIGCSKNPLGDGLSRVSETYDPGISIGNLKIANINNQIVARNTSSAAIAVTASAYLKDVSCLSDLSITSSDTSLIDSSDVTISGTFPDCNIVLTPKANQLGNADITASFTRAGSTISTSFTLSVLAPPTISDIADQVTNEDTATGNIAFVLLDDDSSLSCTSNVTVTSSNTSLVDQGSLSISGTAPNCFVDVTPLLNASGVSTLNFTVSDGDFSSSDSFDLTVNAVNDAPVITAISNQSTNEDTTSAAVNFQISDVDNTLNCSSDLSIVSSNSALIDSSGVAFSAAAPNCIATFTPKTNQFGVSNIDIIVSDGSLTATSSFSLTVNAINDAPTISNIADQTTNEDSATGAINVMISDVDSSLSCAGSLSMSSTNPTLINAADIVYSGSAPNCQINLTPKTNQYGSAVISVSVNDGTLTATDTFILTVNPINDPPVISNVLNQTVAEDASSSSVAITISDPETPLDCSSAISMNSSNITLINDSDVVFAGTYPNCTAIFTPNPDQNGNSLITLNLTDGNSIVQDTFTLIVTAVEDDPVISDVSDQSTSEDTASSVIPIVITDAEGGLDCSTSLSMTSSDTTLIDNSDVAFAGTAPNCTAVLSPNADQNGSATITFTLTDTAARVDTDTFNFTVTAVNDAPTISDVADQVTSEDIATGALAVTINDVETALSCATSITAVSSNTALIDTGDISFSGTAPNCTVNLNPKTNQSGAATITLTVTDGSLSVTDTIALTVNAVNDAPTISDIVNQITNEDTATSAIAFTIDDTETALDCSSSVSLTSSNTTLIDNTDAVFAGTYPNCTAVFTPNADQFGVSTLTLTVTDGSLTGSDSFDLTVSSVADVPVISDIGSQSTLEDTPSGAIAFTISDAESALNCSSSVSMASSNTTLIDNSDVVFAGTAPNCTATLSPNLNQTGVSTISFTVTDGSLTAVDSFSFTVSAVNDPPVISDISNQTIFEGNSTGALAFTISDPESALDCSTDVSFSSSNTSLIEASDVVFAGTAPNCTINLTPKAFQNGSATITLTVSDGSSSASDTFDLTVAPFNDSPVISDVSNQVTNEDTATSAIAFTITDVDSSLNCSSSVSMTSSNTTLIDNTDVVFAGTAPNCTGTLSPNANQNGSSTITLTVTDGFTTATDTFSLTVSAINDAPVISNVADQTINEDANTGALAFTISDVDSALSCNTALSMTSSNTTLIDNSDVVFAGTAPNCTATLSPNANQNGVSNITLTVTDGSLSAVDTFTLTVNALNDVPTISDITNQTINEDSSTSALAFTISDVETGLDCSSSVSMTSSNTTLIDNSDVVFAGTAPNCTATLTPNANQNGTSTITLTVSDGVDTSSDSFTLLVNAVADAPTISNVGNQATNEDTPTGSIAITISDADGALSCSSALSMSSSNTTLIDNSDVVFSGTYPNCSATLSPNANQNGASTITLTVSDGGLSATDSFDLTVNAINDVPVISGISNQTINEDSSTSALAFTISDVDNALDCTTSLTAISSNSSLIGNTDVIFSGTAPNCSAVFTPIANASGVSTISVVVSDGSLSTQEDFVLTVNAVNDLPTISDVTDKSTNEDTSTSSFAVTINDVETGLSCSSNLSMTSSNTTLIDNTDLTIGGSAPNCTVALSPNANQNGTSTITLTVSDGAATVSDTFNLTVNAVNDAPVISDVANQSTAEDTATSSIAFTISDVDNSLTCASSVTMSSSNSTVIDNTDVVFAGTAPNCTATLTPNANQTGSSTITFTLFDGSLTAADSFTLSVNPVNDIPTISSIANQTINEDNSTSALAFTITDAESSLDCTTDVTMTSSNTTLIDNTDVVFAGVAPNCTATLSPNTNQSGVSNITLTVTDGIATNSETFSLTVNAVNDAPVISDVSNQSTAEDTATSAIAFTISDIESSLTCASSVSAVSSNTSVAANSNIVIAGTAPNCNVVISPELNASGVSTITLTVTDGSLTGTDTFDLTVTAVNDAPQISDVSDQSTNEDTATSGIAFTISDTESALDCSTDVTMTSSNSTIIDNSDVVFAGTAPNCTAVLTPNLNQFGSATITFTVTDGSLSATDSFTLTVNSVNDTPTISDVTDQTIAEDNSTSALAFTISDVESTLDCTSSVSMTSSNTTLIDNTDVVFAGTAPNCSATLSPNTNQNGSATITLTVTDGSLINTDTFNLTVTAVDDAPVISDIGSQSTTEDTATSAIAFTISDDVTALNCATDVTMTSANTTLIDNSDVLFAGTAPNCTAVLTPNNNETGSTTITFTVTDGNLTGSDTFNFSVSSVNDAPTISDVSDQTVNEDTATGALAFTINDTESTLDCASSVTLSSSNTALVDSSNVVFAGTAPNCSANITPKLNQSGTATITLTVTDGSATDTDTFSLTVNPVDDAPSISILVDQNINEDTSTSAIAFTISDVESSLNCSSSVSMTSSNTTLIDNTDVVFAGVAPNCTATLSPNAHQTGASTITFTVTDGSLTSTQNFDLTVNAVNDAPTISDITNQIINEDTNTTALAFTINDLDSSLNCASSVSMTSSNTTLIDNTDVVFAGTAPNCSATLSPNANQSGVSTITLTVTDGSLTATDTFSLTVTAVNDTPTISDVTNQTISEDSDTGALAITIGDVDNSLDCSADLSMSSSNTTLIDNSDIVFAGTAPNCTATLTPNANQNGTSTITLTVTDGTLTATDTFDLIVTAVNDAPTISDVANQSIAEDTSTSALAVTINDLDDSLNCATDLSMTSSNTTLIDNTDVVFTGTAPNCTATLTPNANQGGVSTITLTVTDGSLSAADTFTLTVNSSNDAPQISDVTDQTIAEDASTSALAFTINDVDSSLSCAASVSMVSSNTTLINNTDVVFAGTAPNCTATLSPNANQSGVSTITLTVTDGTLTATDTFDLTVTAVNDAPTISDVTNQTINEDSNTGALAVTINDIDDSLNCATDLSMSSSNTTLIDNSDVVFAGTAPNCTATLTPNAHENGTSTITLTVTDGSLTATDTFDLTVNAINDAPTISDVTNQTISEDSNTAALAVTINDLDDSLDCSTDLSMSSSNTTLIDNSDVVFAGTAPNCTATLSPNANQSGSATITLSVSDGSVSADDTFTLTVNAVNDAPTISDVANQNTNEDTSTGVISVTISDVESALDCSTDLSMSSSNTTLIDNSDVVFGGTAPNCTAVLTPNAGENGIATITLTVTDGALTSTDTFDLNVGAVNDFPVISDVTDQTISEDSSTSALAFTISDPESALDCTTDVSMTSSNTTLIDNTDVVFAGTAPNCTATLSPNANQAGVSTITLTVTDGSLTADDAFTLTVNAVNDAPTISDVTNQSIAEDASTSALAITISDQESALDCSTDLSMSSSNTTLIDNTDVVFAGTAPNCTATLTSNANQSGVSTITLTVTDGSLTATDTFALTVNAVNDAPTISDVSDQTIAEDATTGALAVTINDGDNSLTCAGSLSASSSNTALIDVAEITIAGTAPNCTVDLAPRANQSGSATITLTVTDGSLTATDTIALTVNAVNDAPTISDVANQTINEDSSTSALVVTINDLDSSLNCSSSISMSSSNTTLINNTDVVFAGTAPNCTAVLTPNANQNGSATITLTVTDGTLTATDTFSLNVTAVNDAPTISDVANQTINEDSSTSALAITISDEESALDCSTDLSMTSSNTTLIDNTDVVFAGTAPNCTAVLSPNANENGSATITLTVTDGSLTATDTFTLNVTAVNDAPTISDVANQTINEDNTTGALAVTINDTESALTCAGSLSASSSNTTLIDSADITIAGTAPNCTVDLAPKANQNGSATITLTVTDGSLTATDTIALTVTAVNDATTISDVANQTINEDNTTGALAVTINDGDNSLTCAGSLSASSSNTALIDVADITIAGTAPNCTVDLAPKANQNGSATVTLTVTDGSLTATDTIALTVTAVNDAPTISDVANQTINEDSSTSALAVTINDIDSSLNCSSSISMTSSNTTLINNTDVVFAGTAPNCTVVLTPNANQNGSATITLTVTDGSLTATDTIALTVTSINDAPTISDVTNQTIIENNSTSALVVTINDIDHSLNCSTDLSISSSNTTLIDNTDVVFAGTAPNCTATLTPNLNQTGTATITLTVSDGSLTAADNFSLTVNRAFVLFSGAYRVSNSTYLADCDDYINSSYYSSEGTGRYWIDPDGAGGSTEFMAECDMDTDGGGWTLILNYVHELGTNPVLDIRTSNLPLIQSSTLGDNEGGDATSWGHAGNTLANSLSFNELKFYCETSAHSRVMNFKTSVSTGLSYIRTGTGDFTGINSSFTTFAGHSANLPASVANYWNGQGNEALTAFPFWLSGTYHWGIRGSGSRWECDDFANNTAHTIHRVWVRGSSNILVSSGGSYEYSDGTHAASCLEYLNSGSYNSEGDGTYWIDPDGAGGNAEFSAYCDMTTDGGGWTIIYAATGADSEQALVSNTEQSGNPLSFAHYNLDRQKKVDISAISTESLILRNNSTWFKFNSAMFDANLLVANQHAHYNVIVTASNGVQDTSSQAGWSNYNYAGGGDYGVVSTSFDHHSTNYYHLNSGCANHYLYSYSGVTGDNDAGYDVNTALGSWGATVGCASAEGGALVFRAGMR